MEFGEAFEVPSVASVGDDDGEKAAEVTVEVIPLKGRNIAPFSRSHSFS
jgi:hypothetical protein